MLPEEQYRELERTRRRGRRRKALTTLQQIALRVLRARHPDWGLPRLRQALPGLPRNSAADYLKRLRRVAAKLQRRAWERVTWLVPGAVWAIGGTWLDRPVPPLGRRALVVIGLHSRKTLCLRSVVGERAAAVEALLAELFARHCAPLVIKLDNGPGFVARRLAAFCRRHGVTLLHSPVRRPRWNGSCEASVRWAKARADVAWRARGGQGDLAPMPLSQLGRFGWQRL